MIVSTKVDQLDRIERLSRADFERDYLLNSRPVLLAAQSNHWPAVKKWDMQYVETAVGDRVVDVEYYPSGNRHDAFTYHEMPLAEYIRLVGEDVQARKQYYVADKPAAQLIPELIDDIETPELVDTSRPGRTVVFIGYDTFTTAHYHRFRTQALLTQVTGQKRVVLWPPEDLRYLSPGRWYSLRANHSRIPFDEASPKEIEQNFPKLQAARSFEVTLNPGETLFIPDHWMHTAEGIGPSISITFFWTEAFRYSYLPGVIRDGMSDVAKRAMLAGAKIGGFLGMNRLLVEAAAWVGILQPSDKVAVLEYLTNFGTKVPNQREREQQPTPPEPALTK